MQPDSNADAPIIEPDAPESPSIDELIAASSVGAGLRDIEERGIDAHLADLEQEIALAPKKRKKSTSPTARTLAECKRRGWIAGVVERHSPFPKPHGKKHDFLGVIDLIAIAPEGADNERPRTIGIQACSDGRTGAGGRGSDLAARRAKILAEPRARAWVEAGNRLEIWAWGSRVVGKGRRWRVRVEAFTVESWRSA
jgi:hypothetical protein